MENNTSKANRLKLLERALEVVDQSQGSPYVMGMLLGVDYRSIESILERPEGKELRAKMMQAENDMVAKAEIHLVKVAHGEGKGNLIGLNTILNNRASHRWSQKQVTEHKFGGFEAPKEDEDAPPKSILAVISGKNADPEKNAEAAGE